MHEQRREHATERTGCERTVRRIKRSCVRARMLAGNQSVHTGDEREHYVAARAESGSGFYKRGR
jgi:hypothetical protein